MNPPSASDPRSPDAARAPGVRVDAVQLASSHRRARILAWIGSLPLAIVLSAVCALLRAPDAPGWLVLTLGFVTWPLLGLLFDRIIVLQSEAFDAVFSGDIEACRRMLSRRSNSWKTAVDVYGTIALELAVGDIVSARSRFGSIPKGKYGPVAWMRALSESHLLVMSPNPEERATTIGKLLALQPSRKWGQRYRAYLLAQAALHEPVVFVDVDGVRVRDPRAVAVHDGFCRRAADEIRALGDPIAVHFARFIEAARRLDGVKGELPADLRVSAMLARGYGVPFIAEEIDARATAEERARSGPYRA